MNDANKEFYENIERLSLKLNRVDFLIQTASNLKASNFDD